MRKLNEWLRFLGLCVITQTIAISASGQTYTELLSFDGNVAAAPKTPLTQGVDGHLYGTTYYGGTGPCFGTGVGCGVIFKASPEGGFKILYNFQGKNDGALPVNDLTLGDDGNLYGTTQVANGTIFKVTPEGSFTTLHTFSGPDGYGLDGGVIQAVDGNFYGTTQQGGAHSNSCPFGCGTVFKMTPSGALTTIYSFCPQNYCPDGENPGGALVQGIDGNFYGTARTGGLYKHGTVFKISPNGKFKLLYTIQYDPPYPGGLILGTDGNFYGTTSPSGYRITPSGVFTALPAFGSGYNANLWIQGSDGNLYGTTQSGGNGYGLVFQMSTVGIFLNLYDFVGYPDDGSFPFSGLVQATNGIFYGTTFTGGGSPCNYSAPGCGTIFSLDMGLGPFVTFLRRAGKAGRRFGILGQGFTGTTNVSLNGTPASFTIKADTFLTATVPAGATTGRVTVTTPSGTLTSNVSFYVIP